MDGFTFDSEKEACRYAELKILIRAGKISDLELQKRYELQPAFRDNDGKWIKPIYYKADFVYTDNETGKTVIEDVKGANIKRAIYFNGLPEMKIQNVTLRNITMSATEGALFRQTDGLIIDNVNITAEQGEAFSLAPSVENVKIN